MFGLALDCNASAAEGVLAYFEQIGLAFSEMICFGGEETAGISAARLQICGDRCVFYGAANPSVGYDALLCRGDRTDRSQPPSSWLYRERRTVMRAYLRRCGCDRVVTVTDDPTAPDEEKTAVLPHGCDKTAALQFLQDAEQKLLPRLIL